MYVVLRGERKTLQDLTQHSLREPKSLPWPNAALEDRQKWITVIIRSQQQPGLPVTRGSFRGSCRQKKIKGKKNASQIALFSPRA